MATRQRNGPDRPPGRFAGVGVVVMFGAGALLIAQVLMVARFLPNWLATPLVAVTMLGATLALTMLGRGRLRGDRSERRRP